MVKRDINALRSQIGSVWDTLGDAETAARNKEANKRASDKLGITSAMIDEAFKRAETSTQSLLAYVDKQEKQNR